MKQINVLIIRSFTFLFMLFLSLHSFAQFDSNKTFIRLDSGVTAPIGKDTNSGVRTQLVTSCDGNDVRIFPSTNPQSEIHLSISKVNGNVILLSSNTFPVANSWQGAYWSTNGGVNWTGSDNLPNNAPGRGDPSTAFDAAGNGYIATMSYPMGNVTGAPNGYAIQRTINNGTNWQPQTSGAARNGLDKIMVAADDVNGSPNINNFYAVWSNFSINNGRVEFNRSTNGGVNFSAPIGLNSHWGQGANVQTGPAGEVYVCWADYTNGSLPEQGLGFASSTNAGQTFTAAKVAFTYRGIRDNDNGQTDFGGIRVNSFPSMSVDKSPGAHRGRIYVVYAARENGSSSGRGIIQIRWSDNQGGTWAAAQTINIASGRQNWFPWVSVDDINGNIYVIYYSLDALTGFSTNTYVAISNDAGTTFINQRISDVAHTTAQIPEFTNGYCGDYIGIASHGGRAYGAWCDNRTGQWQDYVSQVSNSDIIGNDYTCTTNGNYSVTNVPANSNVTWSISPSGIATLSCTNCNQTQLTKVTNGLVTLTATITNACGNTSLLLSKPVSMGNPPLIGSSSFNSNYGSSLVYSVVNQNAILGPDHGNPGDNNVAFNNTINDSRYSSLAWTPVSQPAGTNYQILNSGATLWTYITNVPNNGSVAITMKLQATGPCGPYTQNVTSTASRFGSGKAAHNISVQPNPAQDYINLSIDKVSGKLDVNSFIYGVKIMDRRGTLRKTLSCKTGVTSLKVSLAGLSSGLYMISIYDGYNWISKQLIVQK